MCVLLINLFHSSNTFLGMHLLYFLLSRLVEHAGSHKNSIISSAALLSYTRFKSTTRSIVPLGAVIETFLTIVPFL